MSTLIKFFRERQHVESTQRFLQEHTIKTFIRERNPDNTAPGQEAYGFDLFVLKDDDVEQAKQLISYEFGSSWGQ